MRLEIYSIVVDILQIYSYLMIAWIIMSYVPNLRDTTFGRWLGRIVDPYFAIFRRFIPPLGMIDISPIVAFFVYRILMHLILSLVAPLIFA